MDGSRQLCSAVLSTCIISNFLGAYVSWQLALGCATAV